MSTDTQDLPAGNPKRKRWLLILLVVVVLAGLASVAWEILYGRWHEDTDDAYVNGNVVQITPQITGTVVSIGADDGDLVQKGQVLVKFDPSDADIALQQAEANLARTVRQVRGLFSNVDGYKADVAAKKSPWPRPKQTSSAGRTSPTTVQSPRKNWPTPATHWTQHAAR